MLHILFCIQDQDKYQFGRTKIFFRAGQVAYLEKLRSDKLRACGVLMQKCIRGWLARRRYAKIRRTVMLVQKYGRGMLARRFVASLDDFFFVCAIGFDSFVFFVFFYNV